MTPRPPRRRGPFAPRRSSASRTCRDFSWSIRFTRSTTRAGLTSSRGSRPRAEGSRCRCRHRRATPPSPIGARGARPSTYFDEVLVRITEAGRRLGFIERDYRIAGRSVRLRCTGPALAASLTRAFAHLASGPADEPSLTVYLADGGRGQPAARSLGASRPDALDGVGRGGERADARARRAGGRAVPPRWSKRQHARSRLGRRRVLDRLAGARAPLRASGAAPRDPRLVGRRPRVSCGARRSGGHREGRGAARGQGRVGKVHRRPRVPRVGALVRRRRRSGRERMAPGR